MSEKKPHDKAAEATKIPDDVRPPANDYVSSARPAAGADQGTWQSDAVQNPTRWAAASPRGSRGLRCADTLFIGCGWSVTGGDEEEILGYMRAHAREAHGKNEFTSEEVMNARRAIQKLAA